MTLAVVETLARLQLSLRRRGGELRLLDAPSELAELVRLAGLADALGLEPRRQPEEREEGLRVEEEGELGDSAV